MATFGGGATGTIEKDEGTSVTIEYTPEPRKPNRKERRRKKALERRLLRRLLK